MLNEALNSTISRGGVHRDNVQTVNSIKCTRENKTHYDVVARCECAYYNPDRANGATHLVDSSAQISPSLLSTGNSCYKELHSDTDSVCPKGYLAVTRDLFDANLIEMFQKNVRRNAEFAVQEVRLNASYL